MASVLSAVDYKLATANQDQLMAQYQRTADYKTSVAQYQAGVAKITTVDQFLNNYNVLKVALQAYGMSDQITSKGLLKQLLTTDPDSAQSVAQKLGNQKWIAFAKAYHSLATDGGVALQSPSGVNSTIARFTAAGYQTWIGNKDSDTALTTALNAKQSLQDAVNISDVGTLYAQYQKLPAVQSAVGYYQRNIVNVKSVADLENDPKLLNMALTAYGIDPTTVSADTVDKLLTQSSTDKTALMNTNPQYAAFAKAFAQLRTPGGYGNISTTAAIKAVTDAYQQKSFSKTLATNTQAQNVSMFGATNAAKVTQILGDAKTEAGLGLATTYYANNISKARTATQFMADKKLVDVAEHAFGFDSIPADTLTKLLTQDPTASGSIAQTTPQYAAFAKAFSFYGATGGTSLTAKANVAAIQTAYLNNQLTTTLQSDVTAAATQATRNTDIREKASAPMNLYQMLGDGKISTVLLGAYNLPANVGAFDADQQVETVTHAGFKAVNLNSSKAIDSLIQRYLANTDVQNATANAASSPVLTMFQTTSAGSISTIDLSSYLNLSSGTSTISSTSPTAYLLNVFGG
ncbi:MAG: DUF1217 domain-containing protein [Terricaulis sp.]